MGFLEDWLPAIGGGTAALGLALAEKGYSEVGDIGERALDYMAGGEVDPATGLRTGGLAGAVEERLAFQPYTVTTTTGSDFGMMQRPERVIPAGTQLPDGTVATEDITIPAQMEYELGLSPEEKALQDAQIARAGMFFEGAATPTDVREQQVYERMRAAQLPEEERQRLELEQRLANQGRLGMRTAMFGGTQEQLAMAQAQEEAKRRTMLAAMQFAGEEQQRQAQLGTGMLAAGYVPQAQLLGAVQPGMTAAERRRQAISEATGAYGETYASGIQALLQSALAQANIAGGVGGRMTEASLGGLFSSGK